MSHFRWYPGSEETIVPWNARYSFPSQANKSNKITPRIPPKNGSSFLPGNIIRLEFPAQGYVNPINTTIEFDVVLQGYGTPGNETVRFQNNIQSTFGRVRNLYGATSLEDIINYNVIVRSLTEWTSTNQTQTIDQVSIAEGIGGVMVGLDKTVAAAGGAGLVNVRQAFIQGISNGTGAGSQASTGFGIAGSKSGSVPNSGQSNTLNLTGPRRRYQVNLATGLFTQDKLLPTKFMASQFVIEITLEQPNACLYVSANSTGVGTTPTYGIQNVNLIPEILEFDASYDAMFMKGLQDGGVPIKFSSWHTFIFSTQASSTMNLPVQERSRSVKALFAVQRRGQPTLTSDSHATFFDTSAYDSVNGNTLQNYQWRIGGRYFPASPVQLSTEVGSGVNNGGAEAFVELQKALNVVGDYRLSSSVNPLRWAVPIASVSSVLPEYDYSSSIVGFTALGNPTYGPAAASESVTNSFCGNTGSCCFAAAVDLETSNGIEISGLNAEEQSDISFLANYKGPQAPNFNMEVYSYYDAMIILRENNVLELIQ